MFVCGTIELNERRRHFKIHGHTKINDTSMYRVSYDPTKKWKATGFQIEFGKTYHIEAKAVPDAQGRPYSDKGLRSTPDGASTLVGRLFDWLARDARSPLNPVGLIRHDRVKRLRVLTDRFGKKAHFLTVIGCIGQPAEADLERYAFVIGSSCDLVGYANGELFAFSNDWPGDDSLPKEEQPYLNNTGTIELSVEERYSLACPPRNDEIIRTAMQVVSQELGWQLEHRQ